MLANMKFLIFFITALYEITNLISTNAELIEKECGGVNSKVAIGRIFKNGKYKVCYGEQINLKMIVTQAHCVNMVNKEDLEIYTVYRDPSRIIRGISNISIHPEYTFCNEKNDLAILTVDVPFHVDSDIICLANETMEFTPELCADRANSFTKHINLAKVEEHCRNISPVININEYYDIGEQICELEKRGIKGSLKYHYSSIQICKSPGQNGVRYLHTYETMAPVCVDEIIKEKYFVKYTNKISDALSWIKEVVNWNNN